MDSNQGYNPYKLVICPVTRVIYIYMSPRKKSGQKTPRNNFQKRGSLAASMPMARADCNAAWASPRVGLGFTSGWLVQTSREINPWNAFPWKNGTIYTIHEFRWFFMVNGGKYTSPMDPMGNGIVLNKKVYKKTVCLKKMIGLFFFWIQQKSVCVCVHTRIY